MQCTHTLHATHPLAPSYSEANDMAIMMARLYSGNYDMICLRNAYHGLSGGGRGAWLQALTG